jgi:hypothetical protein
MEDRMERMAAENPSRSENSSGGREVPPMIHIEVEYDSERADAETTGDPMIFWLGTEMVQLSHLNDSVIKGRAQRLTDSEAGIEAEDRTGREFMFEFKDTYRESRDLADVTALLLHEVYELDHTAITSIEWEDMDAGERLTREEFVDEYGSDAEQ